MSNGNGTTRLEDLATLAGVSVSTASRALNDHPAISTRTKQKIWALAREHDYPFRRHMPAGPIGAEGSIVIVTPHLRGRALPLSHPFFLELLASIGEAARARDCDFTVSHTAPASFDDLVLTTTTSRANGVIFLGQSMLHDELNRLADIGTRFVVWGAQMPKQKYCSVGSDNLLGGRRATQHLARLGRKRIMFLGTTDPEAILRRRGYREGLEESGMTLDPELIVPIDFEMEPAQDAVARLLRRSMRFDGIVASSDLIALGAIRALRSAGLSVPRDVSVVGYDDMLLARLSTPALTTIRQDTQEAGRILVGHVLDPTSDNQPQLLPTNLIVRESCGA
ncbi:LacI family DNA-binding transcriptional regulator [Sphingomonas sp. LT1P40]|uniref:LacI family DNA-binding transcriptional regulator n=1 Tax=Alteristakelama amylovorans TaxID=3096166 RepID=UPI002FC8B48D